MRNMELQLTISQSQTINLSMELKIQKHTFPNSAKRIDTMTQLLVNIATQIHSVMFDLLNIQPIKFTVFVRKFMLMENQNHHMDHKLFHKKIITTIHISRQEIMTHMMRLRKSVRMKRKVEIMRTVNIKWFRNLFQCYFTSILSNYQHRQQATILLDIKLFNQRTIFSEGIIDKLGLRNGALKDIEKAQ